MSLDVSVVIVLCQWLNQQQKKLQRHSQIVTVVLERDHDKDYTHRVMLNDCVSAHWSHS